MRKKIALFAATAAVISGLAVWATMGSAGAIGTRQTFTVIEKDTQDHFVDHPPLHRPNPGDYFTFSGVLRQSGNNAGIVDGTCTFTHSKPLRFFCLATFTLKNQGQIEVQTSFSNAKHFNAGVNGGTGDFQNARGFVQIDQLTRNTSRDIFHLVP